MQVNNPNSGAAATVTTDGVTIQGNGSGGSPIAIKQVETNASLNGAGTLASPLGETPLTWFNPFPSPSPGLGNSGANQILLTGFILTNAVTFAHLAIALSTGDAGHNVDFGLYNAAGTLLANIGAQVITSTSLLSYATVQGSQTIYPARYYLGFTSNGTTAKIYGNTTFFTFYVNTSFGTSAGGALPSTITPLADSLGSTNLASIFL